MVFPDDYDRLTGRFDTLAEGADLDADFSDIEREAREVAKAICAGIHSGSPMYGDMTEAMLKAFTDEVNSRISGSGKPEEENEEDENRKIAAIISEEIGRDSPGDILFSLPSDKVESIHGAGRDFDKYWNVGDTSSALGVLRDVYGVDTVDKLQRHLDWIIETHS